MEKKALILLTLNLLILAVPLLAPTTTKFAIGWFLARGNYGAAASVFAGWCFAMAKIAMASTPVTGLAGALIALGSFAAG